VKNQWVVVVIGIGLVLGWRLSAYDPLTVGVLSYVHFCAEQCRLFLVHLWRCQEPIDRRGMQAFTARTFGRVKRSPVRSAEKRPTWSRSANRSSRHDGSFVIAAQESGPRLGGKTPIFEQAPCYGVNVPATRSPSVFCRSRSSTSIISVAIVRCRPQKVHPGQ
jgi:hypothetical protein